MSGTKQMVNTTFSDRYHQEGVHVDTATDSLSTVFFHDYAVVFDHVGVVISCLESLNSLDWNFFTGRC